MLVTIFAGSETFVSFAQITSGNLLALLQHAGRMSRQTISRKRKLYTSTDPSPGAIAFSTKPEKSWVVAGWAFRQILDDTIRQYPADYEIAQEFEQAKAISGRIYGEGLGQP
jgi:hypothetical protein